MRSSRIVRENDKPISPRDAIQRRETEGLPAGGTNESVVVYSRQRNEAEPAARQFQLMPDHVPKKGGKNRASLAGTFWHVSCATKGETLS